MEGVEIWSKPKGVQPKEVDARLGLSVAGSALIPISHFSELYVSVYERNRELPFY